MWHSHFIVPERQMVSASLFIMVGPKLNLFKFNVRFKKVNILSAKLCWTITSLFQYSSSLVCNSEIDTSCKQMKTNTGTSVVERLRFRTIRFTNNIVHQQLPRLSYHKAEQAKNIRRDHWSKRSLARDHWMTECVASVHCSGL